MQHCDTLIAPRWCIPIEPDKRVLENHAVIVTDGRIRELLPLADARQKYQPSLTLERPDHALIPGLINTHTHAAMTLMRGLADDLALEPWLGDAIFPTEKRWVGAEMVRDGTELAIAEMIAGGTTCFSDQYYFPDVVAATADKLQMRAMVGTPIIEFPTAWARTLPEYFSKATDLVHDPYASHPLVNTCFSPHSTAAMQDDSFTELRVLADQLDLRIQIHLHETTTEISNSIAKTGKRPAERLRELGFINASLLAVHAVHLSDDEIGDFGDNGVSVAHCPKSNLKLASGIAPVRAMLDAGINVTIGTDGAASNNTLDMLSEIRHTALLAKVKSDDAGAIPAAEILSMATIGGARALGLDHEIGSIEAGKWADLTCIDLGTLNSQPVYDPVSQLVYTANASQVSDVWIAGRHQMDNGQFTNIDIDTLRLRTNEWRDRIANHE